MRVRILVILTILFSSLIACEELGLSKTELSGEILILSDDLSVGNVIPLALVVGEDLSELHKEIWEITYVSDDVLVNDTIIISDDMENYLSEDKITSVFNDNRIEIYNNNDEIIQKYNNKIILFIPDKAGEYLIEVMGYYITTSARKVTETTIIIVE